jgi:predicted amidohydrolase
MDIRQEMTFDARSYPGWVWPVEADGIEAAPGGACLRSTSDEAVSVGAGDVHTWNGDAIELTFRPQGDSRGTLEFGYFGGAERALAVVDFAASTLALSTSDWRIGQPVATAKIDIAADRDHVLRLRKTDGGGNLIGLSDLELFWDGRRVIYEPGQDVLPEMGVRLAVRNQAILARRFALYGTQPAVPEHLHVGGYQVLNQPSIEKNLQAICRGTRQASELGIQLLVTPETSLTGLFAEHEVTQGPDPVKEAEAKLRKFLAELADAPFLVVGLPVWERDPEHPDRMVRYNVSRVYDPDGGILADCPKVHSCEVDFWHGQSLNEFDVHGVPVSLHVCHDARYPDTWTLPVMFGARLVLHPANGGKARCSVDGLERLAHAAVTSSHAFYLHVNGGGGSYLVSPHKYDNLLATSLESRRDNPAFPMVGEPVECLLHANLRIHDAFGYWPVRSFRVSEASARAYADLYRARGGSRATPSDP